MFEVLSEYQLEWNGRCPDFRAEFAVTVCSAAEMRSLRWRSISGEHAMEDVMVAKKIPETDHQST